MRSLDKLYPSLEISHNLLIVLGVSDFVSVSHIFAFLSSHYTFLSRAMMGGGGGSERLRISFMDAVCGFEPVYFVNDERCSYSSLE